MSSGRRLLWGELCYIGVLSELLFVLKMAALSDQGGLWAPKSLYLNFDRTASNAAAALATEAMAEIRANFHNLDSPIDRSASITRL
jgi:hypothetical protein